MGSAPFQQSYLQKMMEAAKTSNPFTSTSDVLVDRRVLRALIMMADRALVYEKLLHEDVALFETYAENHRAKVGMIEERNIDVESRARLVRETIDKAIANEDQAMKIKGNFGWPDVI
jgi:hypothetical protein